MKKLISAVLAIALVACAFPAAMAEQPAGWAAADVSRAAGLGLVPETLQSEYSRLITRAEFCALAVGVYEAAMERVITERVSFPDDRGDPGIQKMAGLGVVRGSNGLFDPDGTFSREMAAVLFVGLLDAMSIPLPPVPPGYPSFTDTDLIAGWALTYVGQIQTVGVIAGTGSGAFNPKGLFSRQEAMVLALKLWDWMEIEPEVTPTAVPATATPEPTAVPTQTPPPETTSPPVAENPLVGTWFAVDEDNDDTMLEFAFNNSGEFYLMECVDNRWYSYVMVMAGTYTTEGNRLCLTLARVIFFDDEDFEAFDAPDVYDDDELELWLVFSVTGTTLAAASENSDYEDEIVFTKSAPSGLWDFSR